jgi:DNA-binding transcriptional regulator of glucitol operon
VTSRGVTYRSQVPGKLRPLLTPGWLSLHVISLVLIVTMVLLGRWQLDVSNAKGFSLQNFGYALQWWAFSIFVVWMWVRVVRDRLFGRPEVSAVLTEDSAEQAEPVAYRRYVMPQNSSAPALAGDALQVAYNDYLAGLAAASAPADESQDPERTTQ